MLKPQNLLTLARLCQHRVIYQKTHQYLSNMNNAFHIISIAPNSWPFKKFCDIADNKPPVCSQGQQKEEHKKCAGPPTPPPPPCDQKTPRMDLETKGSAPKLLSEPPKSIPPVASPSIALTKEECETRVPPPLPSKEEVKKPASSSCEENKHEPQKFLEPPLVPPPDPPKFETPTSPSELPKCETQPLSPTEPPKCQSPPPPPPEPTKCETSAPLPSQPPKSETAQIPLPPPPRSICVLPLKCETEVPNDAVTPHNANQTKSSNVEPAQTQATPGTNGQYNTNGGYSKPEELKCNCGPPPEKCPENSKDNDMPTISLKEARRFMYDCLVAAGASPEHASLHADMMIFADNRGVFGHGMARLEATCCNLKNKKICGKDIPVILNESPCVAYIDGKHALGAVIGCYCMDLAIKKAKICGLGFVNCKNATPFGYATFYADRATKNGLIGMAISNQIPTVIPTRAMDPAIGACQTAFAAPISLCDSANIDFSASIGSLGKVEMLSKQKRELPMGWAQVCGNGTTDPNVVLEKGGLLPLGGNSEECGGHKGFCLGVMLEAITGILSGSDFGPKISKDKDFHYLSHTYVAINPEMFAGGFSERLKWFSHTIRNMPPLNPRNSVLMPGDVERKFAEKVDTEGGIKYLKAQMGQCQRVADEFKVKHLGEAKPNV